MNRTTLYWGLLAGILSAVFWVLSIPPFKFSEAAYIAFVPLLLWVCGRPPRRYFWLIAICTGWVSWFAILVWLRHVTWFGTFALSGLLALFFAFWLFAARWFLSGMSGRTFYYRAVVSFGLAGLWVVLEWSRTWVLWGFPWAPLSLSQWERPVVLQIAAWSGAYGVSFLLVLFNLCVAQTFWQRFLVKERKMWMGWFSPDLYLGMAGIGLCIYVFFSSLPSPNATQSLFTAAVVQPYIPPTLKWDTERELENLEILENQTRFVANLESDLILWPEAATPWPIVGTPQMQRRVERLVDELGKPILMGNLAEDPETGAWANGTFLVEPESGLVAQFYAKRELVPFGEFVPAPFGFIDKVVPVGGSFEPGKSTALIDLRLNNQGKTYRVGSLVCYEDVFPHLARESARDGADFFFVATNNAWYGEGGGAEQHAAHSVLRAVENRRPVVRAGNGGWSGWIDSYGSVREVLRDAEGSIFFRGGGTLSLFQFNDWFGRQSFYTRHGDWFVALSAMLALVAWLLRLCSKPSDN
ncbi:MAG: apolipoprotein N-acyltransferase [Puniceicoccaceae bacterium]|nr:MAG: apolipoprotein N-acyltransferase [Puniceicoccaceae bacterium]